MLHKRIEMYYTKERGCESESNFSDNIDYFLSPLSQPVPPSLQVLEERPLKNSYLQNPLGAVFFPD